MLHHLLQVWFGWVQQWGYWGVFLLMAMESSILPVPSEVVMPPAAYWAAQGQMNFWGVVLAGTAGSYFGSVVSYFGAQALGLPLVKRYGKYFLLTEDKILMAEKWVVRYGIGGVFVARLLPVVRHLISIPAGVFRMRFASFSGVTIAGAFIWCVVLSWFGQKVIGGHPELLNSPEEMVMVIKSQLKWFIGGVVLLGVLYGFVVRFKNTSQVALPPGA
ncbi:MAG: DedA family protein [Methylotenera sp.]|nr:DedA family protein [Oligoflexia bacterium]